MNYFRYFSIFVLAIIVMAVMACVPKDKNLKHNNSGAVQAQEHFTSIQEQAADSMLDSCIVGIDKSKPIIVTSLVHIDNMNKSSTLGRMSSEMIAARLAQQGFKVQEVKMSQSDIFVSEEEGEMILSRNLHQIGRKHDVQGFVVGTYSIGAFHRYDVDVFVSLRFVDVNNIIRCSANYIVRNTEPELWK